MAPPRTCDPGLAKKCSRCETVKESSAFHIICGRLHSWCKSCRSKHAKTTKEAANERNRRNREKDPEASRARVRRNRAKPGVKERCDAGCRAYKAAHADAMRHYRAMYRASKRRALAAWEIELTELASRESAHLAVLRRDSGLGQWDVDHIVPLQGMEVSGLHVWNNLQVIPASINRSKQNKFSPVFETRFWL